MNPNRSNRFIAADAYEFMIERSIASPGDLYDLDGETFLRSRNGCIETGEVDLLGGA